MDMPKIGERGVWVSDPVTVQYVSDDKNGPAWVDFEYDDGTTHPSYEWATGARVWFPRGRLLPVGANGYVVVPRHLLDELREAHEKNQRSSPTLDAFIRAAEAVVEAVGPTREDTK